MGTGMPTKYLIGIMVTQEDGVVAARVWEATGAEAEALEAFLRRPPDAEGLQTAEQVEAGTEAAQPMMMFRED